MTLQENRTQLRRIINGFGGVVDGTHDLAGPRGCPPRGATSPRYGAACGHRADLQTAPGISQYRVLLAVAHNALTCIDARARTGVERYSPRIGSGSSARGPTAQPNTRRRKVRACDGAQMKTSRVTEESLSALLGK
jgi:hypothetical protein